MTSQQFAIWSNASFIVVAAVVFMVGGVYTPLISAGFVTAGVTSALFHFFEDRIDRFRWAQRVDEIGMYALLTPLMWAAITGGKAGVIPAVMIPAQFLVLAALHKRIDSFVAVGVMSGVAFFGLFLFGNCMLSQIALLLFAGAFVIRLLNRPYFHGFWHILVSLAGLCATLSIVPAALR